MTSLFILGGGGHGSDILAIASDEQVWEPYTLDEQDGDDFAIAYGHCYVVGVNDSRRRRAIAERIRDGVPANVVHPSALVSLGTKIAGGVVVGHNASVGPNVQIGLHTHLNGGVFVTRAHIGDFVTIGPNATICGDVTIGNDVMIGAGSVVKNLLTIGDGATVGCGAVVVHNVPAGMTVVGNPARPLVKTPE